MNIEYDDEWIKNEEFDDFVLGIGDMMLIHDCCTNGSRSSF